MAYVCEQYAPASAAALLAKIESMLVAAGWLLHDNVSATVKVYSSQGETGAELKQYMWLSLAGAAISFRAYGWWNAGTHSGNTQNPMAYTVNYVAARIYVLVGDKDLFLIRNVNVADIDVLFGHLPKRFHTTPYATLTAPCLAGNGIVISLSDTTNFVLNQTYWFMGAAGEGRWRANVVGIGIGTITVNNLGSALAAGARVGAAPSIFGASIVGTTFGPTFDRLNVGTGAGGMYWNLMPLVGATGILAFDPDESLGYAGAPFNTPGMYVLTPIKAEADTASSKAIMAICDKIFFKAPINAAENTFGITTSGSPIFESNATVLGTDATHLGCAGGFGADDGLIGKVVIIATGTGLGQTRVILDNTDTICEVLAWDIIPNATSHFFIVDSVYRIPTNMNTIAYKEEI